MSRGRAIDVKRKKKSRSIRERERKRERVGVAGEFSLEFYNYFMPLDLQSIINYLFGLACAKSLGEERKNRDRKKRKSTDKKKRLWFDVGETDRE